MTTQKVNLELYVDELNVTASAFSRADYPTYGYTLPGPKTGSKFYNKDISDSSNNVVANALRTADINSEEYIDIHGVPVNGDILVADSNTSATWRKATTEQPSRIVYVESSAPVDGNGSAGMPYNDIQKAIDNSNGQVIYLLDSAFSLAALADGTDITGTQRSSINNIGSTSVMSSNAKYSISGINVGNITLNGLDANVMNVDIRGITCDTIVIDSPIVLSNVNIFNSSIKTLILMNCNVNIMNCSVSVSASLTNIGTCNIIGSYIATCNCSGRTSASKLTSLNSTVSSGSFTLPGTIMKDHLCSMICPDSALIVPKSSNISMSNDSTVYGNDIDVDDVLGCNIIGRGMTVNAGVTNSSAIGHNSHVDENNVFLIGDGINHMKMRSLGALSSGSTLVYDPMTSKIGYQSSSRREKSNIESLDIADSVRVIDGLIPRTFTWNNDTNGKVDKGFIAEEVHAIDKSLAISDNVGNIRSLSHAHFLPHVVNMLKYLHEKVKALESKQ